MGRLGVPQPLRRCKDVPRQLFPLGQPRAANSPPAGLPRLCLRRASGDGPRPRHRETRAKAATASRPARAPRPNRGRVGHGGKPTSPSTLPTTPTDHADRGRGVEPRLPLDRPRPRRLCAEPDAALSHGPREARRRRRLGRDATHRQSPLCLARLCPRRRRATSGAPP